MRILMPSIVDPGARSGASTVTRNLIRLLETSPIDGSVEWIAIPRSTDAAHRVRQAASIVRSLVTPMPAKVAYTYSRAFRARVLERARAEHADLVMINGSDLLWLDPLLPPELPRVLIVHNIEYRLFESQIRRLRNAFPFRALLERECRRLIQVVVDGMHGGGSAIFLSTVDAELAQAAGVTRSIVVPPLFAESVPHHERPARTTERLELGFLGNRHWWPNREGLSWFIQAVLPNVNRPVHLNVFGDGPVPPGPRVTHHGPVADVTQAWALCDLMICPMRSGGGVSIKLAESVFHGLPTLATSFAMRGLPLGREDGVVVLEESDWATWLDEVELAALRRLRIAEAVSGVFTFAAHRERLHAFLGKLVPNA
jgi:glycosyltransferase involved in cell wall biosynthesis